MQAKLTVGAAGNSHEAEADRAADAVVNKAPVRIAAAGPAAIRPDPPTAPPQPAGAGEALQKLGEAFLKTQIGKQLVDAAERLGHEFIATLPGKIVTGAAAVATVAELAREHKALPMQPPAVPLDFLRPGLKAQLRIDGPIDHPSGASITFTIPLGATTPPATKQKGPTASESYRAETARMQQDLDKWRPKSADDPAERLVPGLRPRPPMVAPVPEKKDDGAIQRKPTDGAQGGFTAPALVNSALAASGARLDPGVERDMSARFSRDFSNVRVHADERAAASATAIGARAYAYGDHLVFARGQYAPVSRDGQWVLAHELAHVAQQMSAETPAPRRRLENEDGVDGMEPISGTTMGTPPESSKLAVHSQQRLPGYPDP